ncbi:hypothetical protein [Deinococcus sp.]|uniref:hypothetical protein n=1 Tax=Deinococcus sp. TaxID=47478 RepID=UPI003C7E7EC1
MTTLPTWMLEQPAADLSLQTEDAFRSALAARSPEALPRAVPRWLFLDWLSRQGWLLHGSDRGDVTLFEPRVAHDLSPDEFSKRASVFAASDGLWAMMYALRDRRAVTRMLNMAVQVHEGGRWSATRYFLSFAPRDAQVASGGSLLTNGFVYVLPRGGFEQMPPYTWPGLGEVREPHWSSPQAVRPILRVAVSPDDFPLPVRLHHAARIDSLAQADPWGFPWLENQ